MSAQELVNIRYPHDGIGKSEVELARWLGLRDGYLQGVADGFQEGWFAVSVESIDGHDINPIDGKPLSAVLVQGGDE